MEKNGGKNSRKNSQSHSQGHSQGQDQDQGYGMSGMNTAVVSSKHRMAQLPPDVRSAVRSGCKIASLAQCVEELVMNAVDGDATIISVKLNLSETNLKIRVEDNGTGVHLQDLGVIGTRYTTSRCHSLKDLHNIKFYGFRGESLASIIEVSKSVDFITRTSLDSRCHSKSFVNGKAGSVEVKGKRAYPGLTVRIDGFMGRNPVRLKGIDLGVQLEEIKMYVERLLVVNPFVALDIIDETRGKRILAIGSQPGVDDKFRDLYLNKNDYTVRHAEMEELFTRNNTFVFKAFVSKNPHQNRNLQMVYVNKRFVARGKVHQLFEKAILPLLDFPKVEKLTTSQGQGQPIRDAKNLKYMVYILEIQCPLKEYDLVLNPKKTTAEFAEMDKIQQGIEGLASALESNFQFERERRKIVVKKSKEVEKSSQDMTAAWVRDTPDVRQRQRSSSGNANSNGNSKDLTMGKRITTHAMRRAVHSRPVVRNKEETTQSEIDVEVMTSSSPAASHIPQFPSVSTVKKGKDPRSLMHNKPKTIGPEVPESGLLKAIKEKFAPFRPSHKKIRCCRKLTFSGPIASATAATENVKKLPQKRKADPQTLVDDVDDGLSEILSKMSFSVASNDSHASQPSGQRRKQRKISVFEENSNRGKENQGNDNDNDADAYAESETGSKITTKPKSQLGYAFQHGNGSEDLELRVSSPDFSDEDDHKWSVYKSVEDAIDSMDGYYDKENLTVEKSAYQFGVNLVASVYKENEEESQPEETMRSESQSQGQSQGLYGIDALTLGSPYFSVPAPAPGQGEDSQTITMHSLSQDSQGPCPMAVSLQGSQGQDGLDLEPNNNNNNVINEMLTDEEEEEELLNCEFMIVSDAEGEEWLCNPGFEKYVNLRTGIARNSIVLGEPRSGKFLSVKQAELLRRNSKVSWLWQYFPKTSASFWKSGNNQQKLSKEGNIKLATDGKTVLGSNICSLMTGTGDVSSSSLISCKWRNGQGPTNTETEAGVSEYWSRPMGNTDLPIMSLSAPELQWWNKKIDTHSCKFTKEDLSRTTVIGQVDKKFIAARVLVYHGVNELERKSYLVLFDQHAVHERIRLEEYLNPVGLRDGKMTGEVESIILRDSSDYAPLIYSSFSETELFILFQHQDAFLKFGICFRIESTTKPLSVATIPKCFLERFSRKEAHHVVRTLLEEVLTHIKDTNAFPQKLPKTIHDVFCSAACHTAVKFGDLLSLEACQELIDKLSQCATPFQCAHGRPVLYPLFDIESAHSLQGQNQISSRAIGSTPQAEETDGEDGAL